MADATAGQATQTLRDLAEIIGDALTDHEALYQSAYAACHGGRLFTPVGHPDFQRTFAKWKAFQLLLTAEAWLSAAERLIPARCFWALTMLGDPPGCLPEGFTACCQFSGEITWHVGATPSLALLRSALEATAKRQES